MNSQTSIARLIATIAGIALLLSGCVPTATKVPTATPVPATVTPHPTETRQTPTDTPLLSKPPELVLATNKVAGPDYPEHVVYTLPEMDRVLLASALPFWSQYSTDLLMDIYYPPDYQFKTKLPVVVIVRGFSDKGGQSQSDKDIQQAIDWAKLFAASGMIAVAAQAGISPASALNHVLDYLTSNADQLDIDATRIGFWGCSAQGWPANLIFPKSPYRDSFRAAAFLYSDLQIIPASWPKNLSLFVVRAGKDELIDGSTIDKYVDSARANNIPVDYIVLPDAVHGFDAYQDTQASKDAVQQTLAFLKSRLLAAR